MLIGFCASSKFARTSWLCNHVIRGFWEGLSCSPPLPRCPADAVGAGREDRLVVPAPALVPPRTGALGVGGRVAAPPGLLLLEPPRVTVRIFEATSTPG